MSRKIRAVVFDMDGVLVDARDWHYEALNRALGLFGYEISRFDHLSTYDGIPTRRKLEMLTIERGLPRQLHGLLNELKQRYTMEIVHTRCKPVFHHEFALANLRSRAAYLLGLASNSIRRSVEVMMEKADLLQYFDVLVSNEDVVNGKPDPEMYEIAMRELSVTPEETLVVEDNEHGIKAAVAAGAHVMAVATPIEVTLQNILAEIAAVEGGRR